MPNEVNCSRPEEAMMSMLGTRALMVSLLGYACLLSFTWPHGLAPVVSLSSLPILLAGFSLVILTILIVLGLLFAPFSWLVDEEMLRDQLYGDPYGPTPERLKDKPIRIPLRALINDLRGEVGLSGLVFGGLSWLVVLGLCWYLWYLLAASLDNRAVLVALGPGLWYAYQSLISLLKADSVHRAVVPLLRTTFFFVLLPMLLTSSKWTDSAFVPNVLVGYSLQNIGVGGGLAVEIDPLQGPIDRGDSRFGSLLFYDGDKVWYRPCGSSNKAVVVAIVQSVQIHKQHDANTRLAAMMTLESGNCPNVTTSDRIEHPLQP